MKYRWLFFMPIFVLAGCSTTARAPISPLTRAAPAAPHAGAALPAGTTYVVQGGDTLYSIALAHDLDYKQLAQWNNLASPNLIEAGQVLRLTPALAAVSAAPGNAVSAVGGSGAVATPLASAPRPQGQALGGAPSASGPAASLPVIDAPVVSRLPYSEANWNALRQGINTAPPPIAPASLQENPPASTAAAAAKANAATAETGPIQWQWPAQGSLVERYGQNGNKGIDISGLMGSPVIAAASGKVVYSGSGLRGYGLLIIIRHADDYLSAYAHNEKAMVQEGQEVQAGQVIALMGNTDAKRVELHFEIRRFGKALDPLKLLPPRS